MAGVHVPVIRRTTFNYTLSNTQTVEVPLALLVDTVGWSSGVLLVRVYSATGQAAANKIEIIARNVMTAPEDPQTILEAGTALATCTIDGGVTGAVLLNAALATPIGRYVKVVLKHTSNGNNINVSIGVDLVGRSS